MNWDAVQFALGTQAFDLRHHQPHPPGYIGYVALGWLLNHITGDPNASLTWISVIAGSIAPAAFFALARRFMPSWCAVLSASVFGTSIIMWYYSLATLTVACLVWAVPLLWLAGGPVAYLRESLALADLATRPTSLASPDVVNLSGNFIFVGIGVLAGVNIGLLVIAFAHLRGLRPASRLSRLDRAFLWLWVLPPMLTFLLVHFGQFGYLVLVMPFWSLWLGAAMAALAHRLQRRHPDGYPHHRRWRPAAQRQLPAPGILPA